MNWWQKVYTGHREIPELECKPWYLTNWCPSTKYTASEVCLGRTGFYVEKFSEVVWCSVAYFIMVEWELEWVVNAVVVVIVALALSLYIHSTAIALQKNIGTRMNGFAEWRIVFSPLCNKLATASYHITEISEHCFV